MAYGNTFRRKEIKYLLSEQNYDELRAALAPFTEEDKYSRSTICSVYCDTPDRRLIRTSLEKPRYKEKLRLRTYGIPQDDTTSFLEIKKKFKGVVYKRRLELPYAQAWSYLTQGIMPEVSQAQQKQVLAEIDYMIHHYGLSPGVIILYDRIALHGAEDGELRITFDSNVRTREHDLDLRNGLDAALLAQQPYAIMEIKAAGSFPLWLAKILGELEVRPGSYSKYGNMYRQSFSQHETASEIL